MRSGAGAALRSPTDEAARSRCAPLAEQIGARAMVPAIGVAAKAVTTLAMSGPSAEPQPDSARIRPTLIRRVTSTRRHPGGGRRGHPLALPQPVASATGAADRGRPVCRPLRGRTARTLRVFTLKPGGILRSLNLRASAFAAYPRSLRSLRYSTVTCTPAALSARHIRAFTAKNVRDKGNYPDPLGRSTPCLIWQRLPPIRTRHSSAD